MLSVWIPSVKLRVSFSFSFSSTVRVLCLAMPRITGNWMYAKESVPFQLQCGLWWGIHTINVTNSISVAKTICCLNNRLLSQFELCFNILNIITFLSELIFHSIVFQNYALQPGYSSASPRDSFANTAGMEMTSYFLFNLTGSFNVQVC